MTGELGKRWRREMNQASVQLVSWLDLLIDLSTVLNSFLCSRAIRVQSFKQSKELVDLKRRGNQFSSLYFQLNWSGGKWKIVNSPQCTVPSLTVMPAKLCWTFWCLFFPSQGVLWHFRLIADTNRSRQQGYTEITYSGVFFFQKIKKKQSEKRSI